MNKLNDAVDVVLPSFQREHRPGEPLVLTIIKPRKIPPGGFPFIFDGKLLGLEECPRNSNPEATCVCGGPHL